MAAAAARSRGSTLEPALATYAALVENGSDGADEAIVPLPLVKELAPRRRARAEPLEAGAALHQLGGDDVEAASQPVLVFMP